MSERLSRNIQLRSASLVSLVLAVGFLASPVSANGALSEEELVPPTAAKNIPEDNFAIASATKTFIDEPESSVNDATKIDAQPNEIIPGFKELTKGIAHYDQNEFESASEAFVQAIQRNPNHSVFHHWLGKAHGRIAENVFLPTSKMKYAKMTGQSFKKSVELDAANKDALLDLITFLAQAPEFLGGSTDTARTRARELLALDPSYSQEVLELFAEEGIAPP